jgi:DNA-binding winged helix-turn-helix (wHTH) protein/tetratricopeptide (TPR) repeat protein
VSATQKLLRFGVFELNLDTEELRKSGTLVRLSPQPFKLLALLAASAGQVLSREEIQARLWGEETHVDFEHGVNKCIKQIRNVLGDEADKPVYIETLPRLGYRFRAPVVSKTIAAPQPMVIESDSGERERTPALAALVRGAPTPVSGAAAPSYSSIAPSTATIETAEHEEAVSRRRRRIWRSRLWIAIAVLVVVTVIAGVYWRASRTPKLTEKDTIVIADFENSTGDSVFNGTLRQGLWVALEQSPYLNILSDQSIGQTMALMAKPEGTVLIAQVARDVCVRTGSTATVNGAISMLGTDYVVGLKVAICSTGELMAVEQFTVDSKEKILPSLGKSASRIREKLGESLSSVAKFNRPLEEATTPSLEALRALTQGRTAMRTTDDFPTAIRYYKRALELDPNFAYAYASLGVAYGNADQNELAIQSLRKAFEMRSRVSERERFHIEQTYYFYTGEWQKSAEILAQWAMSYPADYLAPSNLSVVFRGLGQWEESAAEARKAHELKPDASQPYFNLMSPDMALNRLDEVRALYQEAKSRGLDGFTVRLARYQLAFLQRDNDAMREQASWAMGKPGIEEFLISNEAITNAYFGRIEKAAELTHQAVELSQNSRVPERAGEWLVEQAMWNVETGSSIQAKKNVAEALKFSNARDTRALCAFALARAGEAAKAQEIAKELDSEFPLDMMLQQYWLPSIRAAIALRRDDASRAMEILRTTIPIESGQVLSPTAWQYPAYLRGQAYLQMHDGAEAAAEFRKLVDHPGLGINFITGALARLQLGRAEVLIGDRALARQSYGDFLTLWEDADPDIPIYKQAKAEYAKLK